MQLIEEYKAIIQQKLDAFELLFGLRPEIKVDDVYVIATVADFEMVMCEACVPIDEVHQLQCLDRLFDYIKRNLYKSYSYHTGEPIELI